MFNNKKWDNIDFFNYTKKIKKKTDKHFVIIEKIDFNKYKYPIISNKLKNIPFAIKDNIALKNAITSSASKILQDFKPNYTATVYKKLIQHGAIPLVKTNLDELSMGGSGLTSNYGKVLHPIIKNGIIGGSSSGSAYLVSSNDIPFSIGTDTGDSIRKPAAYGGIVGFKPTWGLVSRYGVYDFAPTWDSVGWFTNTVEESAVLMDVLQGYDEKDSSSIHPHQLNFQKKIKTNKKFVLGKISSILSEIQDEKILKNYNLILKKAEKDGHNIIDVKVNKKILQTILLIYRIISSIESFSVNASLTGFLYGNYFGKKGTFEEKITDARTEGLGYEVKRRWLFAMEAISNGELIYHKAQKTRTLIINELNRIFKQVDALVMPSHIYSSPLVAEGDVLKYELLSDNYLGLFNANGSPSITIPTNKYKNNPTALNISAKPFNDLEVLQIAKILESYNNE